MVRFFRKNQKTLFGGMVFLGGAILMTSFGLENYGPTQSNKPAIKINGKEISHAHFQDSKRELESRYRQMLGKNYEMFAQSLNLNLAQNTIDTVINDTLIMEYALARGFRAGDYVIQDAVKRDFPQGFDARTLQVNGFSAESYLQEVEEQGIKEQLLSLISDAAFPSKKELEARYRERETAFGVEYAEFNIEEIGKDVQNPSQDELMKYYEDNKLSIEVGPRINYEYVVFSPEDFLSEIEVPEDEIEFYYTDNEPQFKTTEQLKLRHVQILFPKSNDPKEIAKSGVKAKEVLEKARKNEDFAGLVKKYSEDASTQDKGGDLGWVPRGRYNQSFDEKTYKIKDGGISDLIETDYGYHIVKVEGHKPSTTKPISEVKEEIILKLKKEQAPAFADTKAREFFEKCRGVESSLESCTSQGQNIKLLKSGLLTQDNDPSESVKGLTKKVFDGTGETKQVLDIKDKTVVVNIIEQRDAEIPSFDTVKDRVLSAVKQEKILNESYKRASDFLAELKKDNSKRIQQVGKDKAVLTKQVSDIKESKTTKGILGAQEIFKAIVDSKVVPNTGEKVYKSGNSYVVFEVQTISTPSTVPDVKTLQALRKEETQKQGQALVQAFLAGLKAKATIETDDTLLTQYN